MRHSLRRLGAALALALAACAKQQPLPVAQFDGIDGDALTVASGQQVILAATSSTDPSGAGLTYEWSFLALPTGSHAKIESPHNAVTRFTADVPTSVQEKYVLSLTVRNQYFASAPRTLTITALECGVNAPSVDAITAAPTSINIATPVLLAAAVTDKDNDAACQPNLGNVKQAEKYSWALTALPPGSRAALRDPAAEKASFDPDVAGTYTATLTVTDSTGRSSSGRFDVQVAPCGGAAPAINAMASEPASPNLLQPTQLSAEVADADNSPICGLKQDLGLRWSLVGLPRGSAAQLNDPSALNPSFTPDVPGQYTFALVVTDSTGRSSAPRTLAVQVKDCGGAPPTPLVRLAPSSSAIGQPVSLQVTPQDGDASCGVSETFSYAWSLVAVPGGSGAQIVAPEASAASFVPDVGGDYALSVTITDSRGTSASALTHLSVAPCGNNPPSVDGLTGLPLTPLTGQNVHVTAQVSDPDSSCAGFEIAQAFRWAITMRPAGSAAALADPTARAADFVPDVIGHYQLSLVVTDSTGRSSAPAQFDVQTATCGSSAPQVASVGASTPLPDPGRPFTLFARVVDADNGVSCNLGQGLSLRWEVASRPAGSGATLSDPAAAAPSFTADVPGSYQFAAVATDSTGLSSAPAFLTLRTTTCGTAVPQVTAIPRDVTVEPFQTVHLSAVPFDADTSCGLSQTFAYAWTIVSAPPGSSAILSDPAAPAPSFVPDVAGAYQLSVSVADDRGHLSPQALVTVNATGCATLPPLAGALRADPATPVLGTAVTLSAPAAQATACFAAGASKALQYAWTLSRPAGSAAVLDDAGAAAPRFTPDVAGVYQARLVVRDSHGLESTAAVLNLNAAACGSSNLSWIAGSEVTPEFAEPDGSPSPVIPSGAGFGGASVGTRVTLRAGFVDPPGCGTAAAEPFTYQWALVARPSGSAAHLDSEGAATPAFVPDLPGDYQVAARVSDALGAMLPTRFVTVNVGTCGFNLPTVAIAPPASTALSTFQTMPLQVSSGSASDADNTSCPARFAVSGFTYAWSVSPAGASLTPVTGASSAFTAGAPGTYTVTLVATASNGLRSAPATQVFTVGACGSHAPAISSLAESPSPPQVGQAVSLTAVATDADIGVCGDAIASYTWALASIPAGSSAALSTLTGPATGFTADLPGTYRFTVVATDSFGLRSAPYPVTIETGLCAPSAPAIAASNGAPAIGQALTLTASAPADSCVTGPSFSYTWRIASAPRGSIALLSPPAAAVTFTPDVAGPYAFEVVATDQGGFSSAPASLQLSAGTCGANPPVLGAIASNPASGVFNAGEPVVLSASLTDNNTACGALPQPYRWTWALLSRPAGSIATLPASQASPAFVPDLPGTYQVSAQVTDALGNVSATALATLTTSPCGTAAPFATSFTASQVLASVNTSVGPTALTIARSTDASAVRNADIPFYAEVPVSLSATVLDGDSSCGLSQGIAWAWNLLRAPAGSAAAILNPESATPSFVPDVPGEYDVELTVTDSTGRSSSTVFSTMPASTTPFVAVGSCGVQAPQPHIALTAPVAVPGPISVQALPVGSFVALDASGSHDGDTDPLQLTPTSVPPGTAGAVSGCGLAEALSYRWTVTGVPAAVQPFTLPHADLANPSFTASAPGNYDLTLTVSDGARSTSAPVSIHARGIGSSSVAATPANGSFVVGPANGANIVTTVLDTDGNPLAAVPVSVAVTAGLTANTLAPASGVTGADGTFTALLTSTKAGSATKNGETKTVQAQSGARVLGSASVSFAAGPASHLDWFVQPCDVPAGTAMTCGTSSAFPEVDGYDQYGNVTTGYTSLVAVTATAQPSGATVSVTPQGAGTPLSDLTVDKTGAYQLVATVPENLPGPAPATTGPAPALGVLSNPFNGLLPASNPPVITASAATSPRQVVLDWNGSRNAAGTKLDKTIVQYHVFRASGAVSPGSGTFTEIAVATIAGGVCGGATSYSPCSYTDTDPALADGTQYTYYVEADNSGVATCTAASCSAPSNVTQQFTQAGPATSVAADASTTAATVIVTWRPPATGAVTSYDVLSASAAAGPYSAVATGITTNCAPPAQACSFTNSGVGNNTQVFYEIRTNLAGGTAPATNPAGALTTPVGALTLPGPVNGLAASPVTYKSVALAWPAQANISQYRVLRGTTTAGAYADSFTVGTSSFTDTGVFSGVTYHYAVVAVNATGSSPGTPTDLAVTTPAAPWARASSGLGGGWLTNLAADPSTTGAGAIYAGTGLDPTTAAGVFRFNPAASSWGAVTNGIPNGTVVTAVAFEVVAGRVTHLYAGTRGQGVFASADNGATWAPLAATGLGNGTIATLFVDRDHTLWAGGDGASGGGIYSLASGASAWTTSLATPTPTVQALAQDDLNTGTLWAQLGGGSGAGGGLWQFSGVTWTPDANQPSVGTTDCSLTRANASAFAIDSNPDPAILYWGSKQCGLLSRPAAGTSWANVAGYTTTEITRLLVLDVEPKIWVASAEVGAANGVTFVLPNAAPGSQLGHMTNPAYPANDWEPTALASDPRAGRTTLWAGSSDASGAYLSTNATTASAGVGGSFAHANTGLTNFNVRTLVRDPDNNHLVAAGDFIGVAASANQGGSWTQQTLPGCTTVVNLAYDSATATAFAICQGVQGVYVGTANGTSWTKKSCTGLPLGTPDFSRGIAVQAGTPDTLYLATRGTPAVIWKTDASGANAGATCTAMAALPAAVQDVSAIAVDPSGNLFAGSAGNFVSTLVAGGSTWVAASTGPRSVVRFFLNTTGADTLYAAGQDDGTGVGGVWSAAVPGTITATTTVTWTLVPAVAAANVTASSVVTGFNGLIPGTNPPILFAGTALTPGQQYAGLFRDSAGNWTAQGDGVIGGNVLGVTLPDPATTAADVAHVLVGTSGGGIFKTVTGGK